MDGGIGWLADNGRYGVVRHILEDLSIDATILRVSEDRYREGKMGVVIYHWITTG